MRAVVGCVDDDGVVGDLQLIQEIEQCTDITVVLDHAVGIDTLTGDAVTLGLQISPHMHAR